MNPPQGAAPEAQAPANLLAPRSRSLLSRFVRGVLTFCGVVNLLLLIGAVVLVGYLVYGLTRDRRALSERVYSGKASAPDKIAVIRIEGILFEGFTHYARRQIDAAAADDRVKAVVLRIVSPGGTITASDDLHKRLTDLRNGRNLMHPGHSKPVVVSMGSIAASGGYYIAMIPGNPPAPVYAEPSAITGSIGVYTSFPNVKKLADDYGVKMNTIKAGDLKAGGSPFVDMSKDERQVWQDMVDHAYLRFLGVVAEARKPRLTAEKLQEDVTIDETIPVRQGPDRVKHVHYKRYRADGGIFTAEQALRFGLIDRIGYLDDAVREAARLAHLGDDYQAVLYDRPPTLLGSLLGIEAPREPFRLDADALASAAAPRLWYLAPHHQLSGLLTALGR